MLIEIVLHDAVNAVLLIGKHNIADDRFADSITMGNLLIRQFLAIVGIQFKQNLTTLQNCFAGFLSIDCLREFSFFFIT